MIKGRNFIFTGLQPWDITIGSNAKDIASEISKNNNVLYVSTPLDYITYWKKDNIQENVIRRKVIRKELAPTKKVSANLTILTLPFTILPVNKFPDGPIFDFFNRLNNKRIFAYVRKFAEEMGYSNPILFIDNDVYRSFYANEFLKPDLSIYYRRDNLLTDPYWVPHIERLEPKLCSKCDIILANSIYLAEYVKSFNSKSFDIGQGIDLEGYDADKQYPIPSNISQIPAPLVGYVGWITSKRIDADLLYELSRRLPNCSFVMVGSEDEYFLNHRLHSLSNVYFLGHISTNQVATYIASFDICMNPQLINDITIGNYPRKIDEYLAMGKEVIATRTETMKMFDNYVHNCNGVDEYVSAIHSILSDNSDSIEKNKKRNARIAFAQSHTWKNSVEKLYKYVNDICHNPSL